MTISIGEYVRERLRNRKISNKEAGESIGISESAFEKVLRQHEIYASRLSKLSGLCDENLFEYYTKNEPFKSFSEVIELELQSKIDALSDQVEEQQKRILDQEEVIRLLKEKEQFLNSRNE